MACAAPTISPFSQVDAGLGDAGGYRDGRAGLDVSSPDAIPPAPCAPGNVSGFSPMWRAPAHLHAGACSYEQLAGLVEDCFATATPDGGPGASQARCNEWVEDSNNASCLSCWAAPVTAATWPPVVYLSSSAGGQEVFINIGGCIHLLDPSEDKCALNIEYELQCDLAACAPSCPIPGMGDTTRAIDALDQCLSHASSGVCSAYGDPANQCAEMLTGDGGNSPAALCYAANSNVDAFLQYLLLACGPAVSPPPSDGGVPTDAASDSP
jgi:hypothetical protein